MLRILMQVCKQKTASKIDALYSDAGMQAENCLIIFILFFIKNKSYDTLVTVKLKLSVN